MTEDAAEKVVASSHSQPGTGARALQGTSHTSAFRELVEQHDPSSANRRKWQKSRDDALGPIVDRQVVRLLRKKQQAGEVLSTKEKDALRLRTADEEWFIEADRVVSCSRQSQCTAEKEDLTAACVKHKHIVSLDAFLRGIRKPYLSSSSALGGARKESNQTKGASSLESWKGVDRLSDKERDEIEFQVRVVIKRSLARIKELEAGEEVRKRTTPLMSANPFSRLLGAATGSDFPGRAHPLYAEQLTQHRAAITAFLSTELTKASARLRDMQEARLRARQARSINLAGSAGAKGAAASASSGSTAANTVVAGSKGAMSRAAYDGLSVDEVNSRSNSDIMTKLTAEQVQQFDSESSALVKSLSEDLAAVEAAERKLNDISELQTQLIQHLGSQAEMADHLHQEAVGHALEVGRGNEQLQRAKENNRQASRFLCMFLVGSGLGLLFLHWVD